MNRRKVTRSKLAEIIALELSEVDVPVGSVRPGPIESDIVGDGDEWFMKERPRGQVSNVINRLREEYELTD